MAAIRIEDLTECPMEGGEMSRIVGGGVVIIDRQSTNLLTFLSGTQITDGTSNTFF